MKLDSGAGTGVGMLVILPKAVVAARVMVMPRHSLDRIIQSMVVPRWTAHLQPARCRVGTRSSWSCRRRAGVGDDADVAIKLDAEWCGRICPPGCCRMMERLRRKVTG